MAFSRCKVSNRIENDPRAQRRAMRPCGLCGRLDESATIFDPRDEQQDASHLFHEPSSLMRTSAARIASCMIVSVGFALPELGKTDELATRRFGIR